MIETPAFAVELAKISLLTNVGRINTTMACRSSADPPLLNYLVVLTRVPVFPEMKTALRTYHPVPSLQKTDGNAQDAPRIKNCLKAALLPSELKSVSPSTPEEILEKAVCTKVAHRPAIFLSLFVQARTSSSPYKCRQSHIYPCEPRSCKFLTLALALNSADCYF